jgi:ABC-2 type transport system ATP-binding protein
MTDDAIRTTGLTKRYGRHTAVDSVTMSAHRGQVYGFLGPNGAGKTTTLRMILGLIRPTSGTATVLGAPAGRPGTTRRVGALIEGPGFYPYLSGRENLRVLARYRNLRAPAVEDALATVGLDERGWDRYRTYSLGMKQRLGVAAALLGDPEVVVLDEPTNGLDPAGMAEMRELVVELARGGRTVVLSSHLLGEVQEICDRVGVIHGGRLLRESTVAQLRGGPIVHVRATPTDRAFTVLARFAGDGQVRRDGDRMHLDASPEQVPRLAREFVAAGLDVHELRPAERSLESVFLELTGGTGQTAATGSTAGSTGPDTEQPSDTGPDTKQETV